MSIPIDQPLSRDDQRRVRVRLKRVLQLLQSLPCDERKVAKQLGRARLLMKYGRDGIDRTAGQWVGFGPGKFRHDEFHIVEIDAEGAPAELRAALAEVANLPDDVARNFAGRRGAAELITCCVTIMDNQRATSRGAAKESSGGIELIAGGFRYRGTSYDLTGRPLAMLRELNNAPDRRLTGDMLRSRMGIDDECVDFPEKVIRDTAKNLRKSLRRAVRDAELNCDDPLPSVGRGADLTYKLDLP